jgi:hypothetical protein
MPMFKLRSEVTILGVSLFEITFGGFGAILSLAMLNRAPTMVKFIMPALVFFACMKVYVWVKTTFKGYSLLYLIVWLTHPNVWTPGRDTQSIPLSIATPNQRATMLKNTRLSSSRATRASDVASSDETVIHQTRFLE